MEWLNWQQSVLNGTNLQKLGKSQKSCHGSWQTLLNIFFFFFFTPRNWTVRNTEMRTSPLRLPRPRSCTWGHESVATCTCRSRWLLAVKCSTSHSASWQWLLHRHRIGKLLVPASCLQHKQSLNKGHLLNKEGYTMLTKLSSTWPYWRQRQECPFKDWLYTPYNTL